MEKILKTSKDINVKINNLHALLVKLQYLTNSKRNSIMSEDEIADVDRKVKVINDVFKRDVGNIKGELEMLITVRRFSKNDAHSGNGDESNDFNSLPPLERETRLTHYRSLSAKLTSLVDDYRRTQLFLSNSENDRLRSMYKIARPDLTDDEIDSMASKPKNGAKTPFSLTRSSKKLLSAADKRNKNIKEILKNIEDLTELMNDLSMMVRNTGEHVNKIEINMEKAEQDTEKAKKDLDKALEYQRNYMWYKRIFCVVVGILVLGFIVWVAKAIGLFG